ncbi:hypothetical protein CGCTS75_v007415 [Colletotrichum tropicale]|nr:hypothetical protein CGCTS75_v007415 [Colletotrichum tropicale]
MEKSIFTGRTGHCSQGCQVQAGQLTFPIVQV